MGRYGTFSCSIKNKLYDFKVKHSHPFLVIHLWILYKGRTTSLSNVGVFLQQKEPAGYDQGNDNSLQEPQKMLQEES